MTAQATQVDEQKIEKRSSFRIALILTSLWCGTLLVAIDTTIIAVAVPKISSDFKALDQLSWYSAGYLLTLTAFQPAFANVYRLFDAKITYLISIILFEVGSILCGSAPTSQLFIFGRAVAGVGAAGILQGGLTIITFISTLEQRPLRISIVISGFVLAACLAPAIGGIMTDRITWRWCFWINGPVGGLAFLVTLITVHNVRSNASASKLSWQQKIRSFDLVGLVLLMASVCCLMLALQFGGVTYPWDSSQVIGLLVGCVVLLVAFFIVQKRMKERATLPLRLLHERVVVVGCVFVFFVLTSSYVKNYFLPFYFQGVQGVSVTTSGVRFIPLAVANVVAIIATGALVSKLGYFVPFMVLGQVIEIVGTYLLSRFDMNTTEAYWASTLVLTGLGLGTAQQLPYTAIQAMLSEEDTIIGNALFAMFGQLGAAMAITVGSSILNNGLRIYVPQETTAVPIQVVINAGPNNITSLSSSLAIQNDIRRAWARTVSDTMYFSLAAAATACLSAFLVKNVNLKTISAQRNAVQEEVLKKNERIEDDLANEKQGQQTVTVSSTV